MGQAYQPQPSALIVGQTADQRDLVGVLLEECGLKVIDCESAEAALLLMAAMGDTVLIIFTAVRLPGTGDGVDLAREVARRWPHVHIVTLAVDAAPERMKKLPRAAIHLNRPRPLDILVEAGRATDTPPPGRRH
jgi:DNA-binding NtrC family response regulator